MNGKEHKNTNEKFDQNKRNLYFKKTNILKGCYTRMRYSNKKN